MCTLKRAFDAKLNSILKSMILKGEPSHKLGNHISEELKELLSKLEIVIFLLYLKYLI